MKIVIDEGMDIRLAGVLRQSGHEVTHIAESSRGLTDEEVLSLATQPGVLLITRDKDFGDLIFREGRTHSGILLVRLEHLNSDERSAAVQECIRCHESQLPGAFSVINRAGIRIRRLPEL